MRELIYLRSMEGIDTKVIPYEIFQKCRGERDAQLQVTLERRARLLEHYTNPAETPEDRRAQLIKHYADPI
jgi:hypothetical protein